jgi:hypothetical protein
MDEIKSLLILVIVLLFVLEKFGGLSFRPKLLTAGVRVYRETRPLPEPEMPPGSVFETESGRFEVIGLRHCFFYATTSRDRNLVGSILWAEGRTTVEARIPYIDILFKVALLIIVAVMCFLWTSRHYGVTVGIVSALTGEAALVGYFAFSLSRILRTAGRIVEEFEAYVTGQHGKTDSGYQWTSDAPR